MISHTILQNVTRYEAENPEIQQSIINYHMTLQSYIGTDEFMSYINVIDALFKEGVTSQEEGDVWQEPHHGLPDSPYMDDAIKKMFKRPLTPIISFSVLRYVSLMNKV